MSPQLSFLLGFALLSKAKGKVKATPSHLQTKLLAKGLPPGAAAGVKPPSAILQCTFLGYMLLGEAFHHFLPFLVGTGFLCKNAVMKTAVSSKRGRPQSSSSWEAGAWTRRWRKHEGRAPQSPPVSEHLLAKRVFYFG